MKHLFRLLFLLLLSGSAYGQSIVTLGSSNNTVEVKGGIKADSALQAPWTSSFTGKGVDMNGRLENSRIDSLPTWMRRGIRYKMLTTADSQTVYIPQSERAANNGVASLDNTGKVPLAQLPALISSGQVYIDNSQAAMLAHAGATAGALSVRTDSSNELFVLLATPSNVRANWVATTYTNAVLAFGPTGNLRTGVVNPRRGDYITDSVAEGPTNLYFTAVRAQAQILLDTPSTLATQYYVNTHSAGNLQQTLLGGDTTTQRIAILNRFGRTFDDFSGFNIIIDGNISNGRAVKIAGRDSTTDPFVSFGLNSDATGGTTSITAYAGQFGQNKRAGVILYADTTDKIYAEILGRNNNYLILDTAHIKMNAGSFSSTTTWAALTASRNDTIPNKSGTFALTSDVSALGLNGVLTNNPNTNQNINIGKVSSAFPLYRNVFVGLNADSTGLIKLMDTTGSNAISLITANNDAYVSVQGGSGSIALDGNVGVIVSGSSRTVSVKPREIDFSNNTAGLYKHINDSADYSTVPLKIGKLTSASRPYGSVYVGLSGGSDSSGKVILQDTANATTITMQTASTTAQIVCASTTTSASISSSTGVTAFHLTGNGGNPTIVAGAAAGASPTATLKGTDLAGYITITPGSGSMAGTLATITFANSYGATPNVILITPANRVASQLGGGAASTVYADQAAISATTFTLGLSGTLSAGTPYLFYYHVIK